MKQGEFVIDEFLQDLKKDPEVRRADHDEDRHFIGIDFGELEYTVTVHYLVDAYGRTLVTKIIADSQEIGIDTIYDRDVKSRGLSVDPVDAIYSKTQITYPIDLRIKSADKNERGEYRFDYGRNNHPRSPRKRK